MTFWAATRAGLGTAEPRTSFPLVLAFMVRTLGSFG
jgi:hypothetical protein